MNLLTFLSGKKTYLTVLAAGVLLFGSWQAWWKIPGEVYAALLFLVLAFLRSAVAKSSADPGDAGAAASAGPGAAGSATSVTVRTMLPIAIAIAIVAGCVAIAPGEDPLVVNTERAETIAKGTFDLVMQVDASQHEFWRTNQPAFHTFVQWLREPQTVESNTLPRCAAFILTVDNVKLAYKAGRASSNDLVTAGLTLNAAAIQAGSWLNLVTNKPPL